MVQYRVKGAVEAAKVGALASLIRSVASFSIYRLVMMFIWNLFKDQDFPWKRSCYEIKTNHSNENTDCLWNFPPFHFWSFVCHIFFCLFRYSKHHLCIPLKSFSHLWQSHNIPYITNILCIFIGGRTKSTSVSHQRFLMTSEKTRLCPLLLEKWSKNTVGNRKGVVCSAGERAEEAEDLGHRPVSAPEQQALGMFFSHLVSSILFY